MEAGDPYVLGVLRALVRMRRGWRKKARGLVMGPVCQERPVGGQGLPGASQRGKGLRRRGKCCQERRPQEVLPSLRDTGCPGGKAEGDSKAPSAERYQERFLYTPKSRIWEGHSPAPHHPVPMRNWSFLFSCLPSWQYFSLLLRYRAEVLRLNPLSGRDRAWYAPHPSTGNGHCYP